ncbi:hypothetical protein [Nocardia stercoris]|uniref:hypothetical protein n=1 Tax=Nocardia stercoris TaxID=2483361 RepID=UPI001319FF1C|nr:hypothetical protein [Nocardia stercoris]
MTTTTVPVTTTTAVSISTSPPPAFNTGSSSLDNVVNAIAWALSNGSSITFNHGAP